MLGTRYTLCDKFCLFYDSPVIYDRSMVYDSSTIYDKSCDL